MSTIVARSFATASRIVNIRRPERIAHEHGDRHRADAPRHWCHRVRSPADGLEIHVTHERARLEAVDADIDDPGPPLYHVAGDHARPARPPAKDVGPPRVGGEIARA